MNNQNNHKNKYKKVVIKVGTSTLTHDTGLINIRKIERLARIVSDIKNSGVTPVIVTSAAIGVGRAKLSRDKFGDTTPERQAAAAIGQAELMNIYGKFFMDYGVVVAQILLTKDVLGNSTRKTNVTNTLTVLLDYGVLPIVNENDTVAIEEVVFGDNDTLSAYVATLLHADLLVLLTDVEGFYTANPRTNPEAQLISTVNKVDDEMRLTAGGIGSTRGTGGMMTKLQAAEIATANDIPTIIASGENPDILYDIMEGKPRGTYFVPNKE